MLDKVISLYDSGVHKDSHCIANYLFKNSFGNKTLKNVKNTSYLIKSSLSLKIILQSTHTL